MQIVNYFINCVVFYRYISGRLKLEAINAFVEVFNNTLRKKYNLLSQPKGSLKSREFTQALVYRNQSIDLGLKGKK